MSPKVTAWMTDEGETTGGRAEEVDRELSLGHDERCLSDNKVAMLKCQLDALFQNPGKRSESCQNILTGTVSEALNANTDMCTRDFLGRRVCSFP